MKLQPVTSTILPFVAAALLALLAWPVLRWVWNEWWSNDYYSHGSLILLVSTYLGWRVLRTTPKSKGDNRGLIILAVGLALFVFLLNRRAMYLAAFATIMMLAGMVWALGGGLLLKRLAFPLGFLGLAIPLPIVERATLPLSLWAGTLSGSLVRWLGLDVAVTGAAVTLPNTTLTIGAQCSGINSMIALLTLTTLAAYLLRGPWWGRLGLVAAAIPLAMMGNVLRIANLLVVARFWGADAAFRFYHDYSGPVFFVTVLIVLVPLSRLLQCKSFRLDVL